MGGGQGWRLAAQTVRRGAAERRRPLSGPGTPLTAAWSSSIRATSSCSTPCRGQRRQITRTTGNESNPRWARHETAVTFVRENNLFLVPLDSGEIAQLTDVEPRKREVRETDSQKFIKTEEPKLIEHTRVEEEKKKKAEEKAKARALPKFELAERQSVADLQLSPDNKHVFFVIVERTDAAKRPNVPNYVTESSYTEDIPARTFVGDAQDKRTLAVMNLETGKTQLADAGFAGKRDARWAMALLSETGATAVAHVRAANNKDRWLVAVDAETGQDAGPRRAARRCVGARTRRFRTRAISRSAGILIGSTSGFSPNATAGCTSTTSIRPPSAAGVIS